VTHVTFGDPSAWENPPNPGHGCGFSVGDFESTRTRTCPTHTRVPARVCKPVTGPTISMSAVSGIPALPVRRLQIRDGRTVRSLPNPDFVERFAWLSL